MDENKATAVAEDKAIVADSAMERLLKIRQDILANQSVAREKAAKKRLFDLCEIHEKELRRYFREQAKKFFNEDVFESLAATERKAFAEMTLQLLRRLIRLRILCTSSFFLCAAALTFFSGASVLWSLVPVCVAALCAFVRFRWCDSTSNCYHARLFGKNCSKAFHCETIFYPFAVAKRLKLAEKRLKSEGVDSPG